jgi:hypothetical protein
MIVSSTKSGGEMDCFERLKRERKLEAIVWEVLAVIQDALRDRPQEALVEFLLFQTESLASFLWDSSSLDSARPWNEVHWAWDTFLNSTEARSLAAEIPRLRRLLDQGNGLFDEEGGDNGGCLCPLPVGPGPRSWPEKHSLPPVLAGC